MLAAVVKLISGVIQGSVIGPLMFFIYTNDLIVLLSLYNIKLKLFADDIKLYVKIVTEGGQKCVITWQSRATL